jgi:N-formylglutamate amidohydrolase
LLSVPHSGREYPDWLIGLAAGGKPALSALEDPLVDRLVWRALQHGCGAVIARSPRAAVDCNRAEDEIDPSVIDGARRGRVSARARGGLGIVPARTQQHGYLWRRAITPKQLEDRLNQAHRPYHEAIEEQLGLLLARHGCALLLDCHSMPSIAIRCRRLRKACRHWSSGTAADRRRTPGSAVMQSRSPSAAGSRRS